MYFKPYIICNNYYARFYSKRCAGHRSRNNSYYDKRIAITICGHGANDCARVLKCRYHSLALCNPNDILYIIIILLYTRSLRLSDSYTILYIYIRRVQETYAVRIYAHNTTYFWC